MRGSANGVDGPAVRLSDLGGQLRRRWRVIAWTVLACVLLGTAFALFQPASYTATSVLTVNALSLNPYDQGSSSSSVNITTERAVVGSTEVADTARETIGSQEDPRDLIERIEVTSPMEAQVIEIAATEGDPKAAADLANAFADGYLSVRGNNASAELNGRIQRIDDRLRELREELANQPNDAQGIQEEISTLRDQRSGLVGLAVDPGRVITRAAPPREESSYGLLVFLAGGLASGLLAGCGLALVAERADRRVRGADRLAGIIGPPVLEFTGGPDSDEFVSRLLMRVGLRREEPCTIGVLGVDRTSAEVVAAVLVEQLLRAGHPAQLMNWQGGLLPSGGSSASTGDGRFRIVSTSVEVGVARAAMLGQQVDKVVLTASETDELAVALRLIEELAAVGLRHDVAVVQVDRSIPPTPPNGTGSIPSGPIPNGPTPGGPAGATGQANTGSPAGPATPGKANPGGQAGAIAWPQSTPQPQQRPPRSGQPRPQQSSQSGGLRPQDP
ncbi:capsular polysaccharide biosynthesis protein [Tamaricihabitans halophyticus]|uniref:Capsular polysaccharide biosynthesis protein n=1 Tax=Tamaricihabitans halophyticus TaxID=1262583 RepID=A0A4R2R3P8_9PSEU|nr:Wzz/FepE/Etk N-terminal domain-containing protein [Tamaricihabitans halophyticus]TCP56494.1 capsular polysaccharide biosynthesis protein [Tamaricihabitans halophyticus]